MTEWITTKEASDILGVNIRTIQRYVEKGKLKAKIVSGKNVVKKDTVAKLMPPANAAQTVSTVTPEEKPTADKQSAWQIPEGYLMIDKATLESLRDQIKKLTDSVGEMQLTQKLLIEKGLNLKDNAENTQLQDPGATPPEGVIDTPIETVAKAHEEFFGKKSKNLSVLWIVLGSVAGLVLLLLLISLIAGITI